MAILPTQAEVGKTGRFTGLFGTVTSRIAACTKGYRAQVITPVWAGTQIQIEKQEV